MRKGYESIEKKDFHFFFHCSIYMIYTILAIWSIFGLR
jgi:hypothetical protein